MKTRTMNDYCVSERVTRWRVIQVRSRDQPSGTYLAFHCAARDAPLTVTAMCWAVIAVCTVGVLRTTPGSRWLENQLHAHWLFDWFTVTFVHQSKSIRGAMFIGGCSSTPRRAMNSAFSNQLRFAIINNIIHILTALLNGLTTSASDDIAICTQSTVANTQSSIWH